MANFIVCLAVIMFELTGGLQYILPLMVALVWAKWTGDWTQPGGIYIHLISFKGYPHVDSSLDLDEAGTPSPYLLLALSTTLTDIELIKSFVYDVMVI
jgi:hypothetical protein